MKHSYKPRGTCSSRIDFELEKGTVKNIAFTGGCSGNTQGVARLSEGRPVQEVISCCKGILCGSKSTSCPDQLARALEEAAAEEGC